MLPTVRIGSEAHKELLCQFFIESHVSFDPAAVDWPPLEAAELARLHSLPFWGQAVLTERQDRIVELWTHGWTVPEISQELGLPLARVSDEKYKAIRKLRGQLAMAEA